MHLAQILFLLLLGVAFVLFSVWARGSGRAPMVAFIIGGVATYVGLLSRLAFRDKNAWQRRVVDRLWNPLCGTPARAWIACVILLAPIGIATTLLVLPITVNVELAYDENALPLKVHAEDAFIVSVSIPNRDDVPEPVEAMGGKASLKLPSMAPETNLVFTAEHPAFEPARVECTLAEAVNGVPIKLAPRPALVLRLDPTPDSPGERYEATARLPGTEAASEARALNEFAEAMFIVERNRDWILRVEDKQERRYHQTENILVDRDVKSFVIDLRDKELRWAPLSVASPPEEVVVARAEELASSPIGERLSSEAANRFLYGGLPADVKVIQHTGFVVSYNPKLKIPNWVAYRLIKAESDVRTERGSFKRDKIVPPEQSARLEDYRPQGRNRTDYDRGSLVPPADMAAYGGAAMCETALLSVIAPQTPQLNRRTWLFIEHFAREYVKSTGEWVCVAAGPAFIGRPVRDGKMDIYTIGESKVAVPTHFWRVHTRLIDGKPDVLCFLVPNEHALSRDVTEYIVTLRKIEQVTRLEFFRDRPDEKPNPDFKPQALWE